MQRFFSTEKGSMMRSIALSLVFSTLFIAVSVVSATTISTSITTGGDLSVTGTSALTGLTTMVYASSTSQSLTGNLLVAGRATTTGSSGNLEVYGGLTVGNATANSLAGTILLAGYTTASEPTGVTQGTFYYNSTNKTLKMFDGSNWFTVGTTTGGLSLNTNNIRLDDVTLRNLTLGTTTQPSAGKALVTLEATTTASIPLSLVGFSGQTAHLLDILNGTSVAGPKLLYISSNGGLFASSTGAFGGTLTVGGELTATTSVYLATTGGTVGVGTTTPGATFSVHGNGLVSGTQTIGGTLTATSSVYLATDGGSVGVATSTPGARFSVHGNELISGSSTIGGTLTATSSAYLATVGGSVGVATSTPGARFSVHGSTLVSATSTAGAFIASTTGVSTFGYITTTSSVSVGTTTAATSTEMVLSALNATSTLAVHSEGAKGGCIEFLTNGNYFYLIATTTGPAQFGAGKCE